MSTNSTKKKKTKAADAADNTVQTQAAEEAAPKKKAPTTLDELAELFGITPRVSTNDGTDADASGSDNFFTKKKKNISETEIPSLEEQDFVYGRREAKPILNGPIGFTRLGFTDEPCVQESGKKQNYESVNCNILHSGDSAVTIGMIPRISVLAAWDKARNYGRVSLTKEEWDNACKKIARYLGYRSENVHYVMIQDVMTIPELAFEELFLSKADKVVEVLDYAIRYDIKETETLLKKWKKIKNYAHKVELHVDEGGIFNDDEVVALRSIGVYYLNDIKKQNIYILKHHMLMHDFSDFIRDINEAFKEDLEKRKDKRYKVYPFVIGFTTLVALLFMGYSNQYTLIKDASSYTPIINAVTVLWALGIAIMVRGAIRAVRRRRTKAPDYYYFTSPVVKTLSVFSLISLFTMGSLALFYQRYDGYDNTVYYRDVDEDEGTIAIAGLRDKDAESVIISRTMDDKLVVEVDLYAFYKDDITEISLPTSVKKVDKYAFSDCEELKTVTYPTFSVLDTLGIDEIGNNAFKHCSSLTNLDFASLALTIGDGVFSGCDSITSVSFERLESMGESAFADCNSLKKVIFGSDGGYRVGDDGLEVEAPVDSVSITEIPNSAFRYCHALTEIVNFDYIKNVGKKAFYGCISLGDLDFSNVETIGKKAFYNCQNFENIVITDTTTEIGKDAFSKCNNLDSVTLPFIGKNRDSSDKHSLDYFLDADSNLNKFDVIITDIDFIHGKAFKKCSSVGTITLPDSVTEIEEGAFDGAKGLTAINIPENVTVLEKKLFKDCSALTEINGGEGVKVIGESVFEGCISITSVNFPELETIGENAFDGCWALEDIGSHASLNSIGNQAFADCSALDVIDISMCDPSSLGEGIFRDCSSLSDVYLPLDIEVIPEGSFENCSGLTNFDIGSSVVEIGKNAFKSSGIGSPDFPESLRIIGKSAFNSCQNIHTLSIPKGVEEIGKGAFKNCPELRIVTTPFVGTDADNTKYGFKKIFGTDSYINTISVTNSETIYRTTLKSGKSTLRTVYLASGVTEIKASAFKNFNMLEEIYFPDTLITVGKNAFKNCDSLQSFDISDSNVEEIGKNCLSGCNLLRRVEFPETLKSIPDSLLKDCHQLETVVLAEGLEEIGKSAFKNCYALQSLYIPDTVTKIGKGMAQDCNALEEIHISTSLEKISKNAFRRCELLENVVIPESVKVIDDRAFYKCESLEEVKINYGVEKIGRKAFYKCVSLRSVSVPNSVEKMEYGTFRGCSGLREVSVPFVGKSPSSAKRFSYITDSHNVYAVRVTNAEKIAGYAFKNRTSLRILILNDGIEKIGDGVVSNCYNVTVYLPESLMKYEESFMDGKVTSINNLNFDDLFDYITQ